jgi:hypothetical protein
MVGADISEAYGGRGGRGPILRGGVGGSGKSACGGGLRDVRSDVDEGVASESSSGVDDDSELVGSEESESEVREGSDGGADS